MRVIAIAALMIACACPWPAAALPAGARPLETEISPERPLIILYGFGDPERLVRSYQALEPDIRPYCMPHAEWRYVAGESLEGFRRLCQAAQEHDIPLVFQIAGPDHRFTWPLDEVERFLRDFPTIKGIMMVEISYNDYSDFGGGAEYALSPYCRYSMDAIKLAARHGKFFVWQLAHANFLYLMAGGMNLPLYATVTEYRDYVIPQHEMNVPFGMHQAHTAPLGMWLEGAAAHWGIEPQSWYWTDSEYADIEDFTRGDQDLMPPAVYRQMILTGVTAGATVYSFEPPDDLWQERRSHHWREAIYPTMMEVIRGRLIPTREQVMSKVKVAYQLAPAADVDEMHRNLRDVNEILDEGILIHGTYGVHDEGLEYEFIPNTGRYYWIPLLSPHAPAEVLSRFAAVVRPGQFETPAEVTEYFNQFYAGDGEGSACIMSIGAATYVMQTHENLYQEQTYRISLPARPARVQARPARDGVLVTWSRREGDRSYRVWRRAGDGGFEAVTPQPIAEARFLDPQPPPGAWYAVSAVTDARETVSGTVNLHDGLIFSNLESPLSEAVNAAGERLDPAPRADPRPARPSLSDRLEGLAPAERAAAAEIAERIARWKQAIVAEDLPTVLDIYAADYRDPDGYGFESAARAYQWLFRRYDHPFGRVIIRGWDFSRWAGEGVVGVRVYAVFRAVSVVEENPDDLIHFPRRRVEGTLLLWRRDPDGAWRMIATDPPLPSLDELLIYST